MRRTTPRRQLPPTKDQGSGQLLSKLLLPYILLPWKTKKQKVYTISQAWKQGKARVVYICSSLSQLTSGSRELFHAEKKITVKGQIKSKADWHAVDSLKNVANEFVLLAFLLFTAKQNIFVCPFFGRFYGAPKLLRVLFKAEDIHKMTYIFTILFTQDNFESYMLFLFAQLLLSSQLEKNHVFLEPTEVN